MTMEIGGVDLRLGDVPRSAYDARRILAVIAESWPDSVFEGLEDETTTPVHDVLRREQPVRIPEFFVYRDAASARDWDRRGATAKNGNRMLHFLSREVPRGKTVEVTMVAGDITPEIGRLYWAIDNALTQAKGRTSGRQRTRTDGAIAAELRAAGSRLSPDRFADALAEVQGALYPNWTIDELACHPHDALQFCEAVRTKVAAAVPDHVIMRVLFSRRKDSLPQHP
jgi:hypothetical protein